MDLTTATPTVTPIWSGLVGAGNKSDTQPVFSPDGNYITYTEPVVQDGTQVMDYELDKLGQANNLETDLTSGDGDARQQPT